MHIISKYFHELSEIQKAQFSQLSDLYNYWNAQINVISRQDILNLYEHHVLHSLAIAKFITFKPNSHIFDVGTGGGFPGVPLAIMFPDVHFYLCDPIKRKIKVVQAVCESLKLKNVTIDGARSEQVNDKFDFIISRAVSKLPKFVTNVQKNLKNGNINDIENGIIYLKGGDLDEEIDELNIPTHLYDINKYFEEEYFETKKIVYLTYTDIMNM